MYNHILAMFSTLYQKMWFQWNHYYSVAVNSATGGYGGEFH